MPDLIKYALALDADVPANVNQMPAGSLKSNTGEQCLKLTVPHHMKRTEASYPVQASSRQGGWFLGAGHTLLVEDSETRLMVRGALPMSNGQRRFIRLAVQAAP